VNELLKALTDAKGTQTQRTIMIILLIWLAAQSEHLEKTVEETARRVAALEQRLVNHHAPGTNTLAALLP
jgi:hypothetical protein